MAAKAARNRSLGLNPTERVKLGRTPLQVTRLGFGTAPLGGLFQALADDDAHRVVEAAWSAGIRFFDTAPQYGNGLAEQRLGAVLGPSRGTSTCSQPRSAACSVRARRRRATRFQARRLS